MQKIGRIHRMKLSRAIKNKFTNRLSILAILAIVWENISRGKYYESVRALWILCEQLTNKHKLSEMSYGFAIAYVEWQSEPAPKLSHINKWTYVKSMLDSDTTTWTDADADVFLRLDTEFPRTDEDEDEHGSAKSAKPPVTGQSGRQKSVWDPCASSFEFGGLLAKMALKRTFAKVIVKMPGQIPWARQARQLKLNFYVTMTYSPVAVPSWPTSERPSAQVWCLWAAAMSGARHGDGVERPCVWTGQDQSSCRCHALATEKGTQLECERVEYLFWLSTVAGQCKCQGWVPCSSVSQFNCK